jgi:chromosome segregation ATPase
LLDTALEEKAQLKADLEAAKKVKPAAVTDLVVDHSEELDAVKAQLAKVQAQLEAAKKPAVVTTPAVDTKELDAVRAQLSEVQGQLDATRSAIDDATRAKTEALAQIELLKQELAAEKVKPRLATAGSLQSVTSSADATELALWKSAVKGMVIRSKRLALPDSELTPELLATLVAKTMDAVKVANTPFSPSKRK